MLDESHLKKLHYFQEENLLRQRQLFNNRNHLIIQGKIHKAINFASNDYLALARHPKVNRAFLQAAQHYGLGSGSSPLVAGFFHAQRQLEEEMASFLNRESSLLFNSGYQANLGIISALGDRHTSIIADKLCHASLLDGIQLSRAKHYRYQHQNIQQAKFYLEKITTKKILLTESIFSMEGDITPLHDLLCLAQSYNATFIVDDAHGFGILGGKGSGCSEYFALKQNDIDCLVIPLGKALGGFGAIVSGTKNMIDYLLQFSRSYRYSTALPPAVAAAALTSLKLLMKENWRREKLKSLINYFNRVAISHNLSLISKDLTPIKSILVGTNTLTLKLQNALLHQGFLVSAIRPPTVPKNTARLRISLNCNHREKQIDRLLAILAEQYFHEKMHVGSNELT